MADNSDTPLRFLVVDALAGVQKFAHQLLEGFGFAPADIVCAADPETALALGQSFKPDVLLTDWFAKGSLSGLQLHQKLQSVKPGCRLALLCYDITAQHEADAIEADALFLLHKPFTAHELKDALQGALDVLAKDRPALRKQLDMAAASSPKASSMPSPPLRSTATTRPPARPEAPMRRIELPITPPQPALRPGDKVKHEGKVCSVQHVVIRHGELVVQLQGVTQLVPASKLQRA